MVAMKQADLFPDGVTQRTVTAAIRLLTDSVEKEIASRPRIVLADLPIHDFNPGDRATFRKGIGIARNVEGLPVQVVARWHENGHDGHPQYKVRVRPDDRSTMWFKLAPAVALEPVK